jgi:hypothetical protein
LRNYACKKGLIFTDYSWAEYGITGVWIIIENTVVYATHGMGPACQALNIHRGDK